MREIVEHIEALLPAGAWPAWTGSNHDMFRFATRWAGDDPRADPRPRSLMLLGAARHAGALPGRRDRAAATSTVAHEQTARSARRALLARLRGPRRDAHADALERHARVADSPRPASIPWLPIGDTAVTNVASQAAIPSRSSRSRAISSRCADEHPTCTRVRTQPCPRPRNCGPGAAGSTTVVVNFADNDATLTGVGGRVILGTDRARDREKIPGDVAVRGWEALVIET